MRRLIVFLVCIVVVGCAGHKKHVPSKQPAHALVVSHSPNPCNVHSSSSVSKKRYPYMWFYRTEVKNNLKVPLQMTHFEFYRYENEQWIPWNITGRPLTSVDFTKWYIEGDRVKDGWVQPNQVAVCDPNWTGSYQPKIPRTKWVYTAQDPEGHIYYAEAEIELVPIETRDTKPNEFGVPPYDKPPRPIGGFATVQRNLVYPEEAHHDRIQGKVIIQVLINAEGEVEKTRIVKSLRLDCDKAATKAIKDTQWKPAEKEGKLMKTWVAIPVIFRL